ncbi:MAG TPA: hypothetical protein VEX69_10670 [Candidatus Limnocylindria bacterium]|nr:hypothetical protein [Candidatus Limnocylindria bacterium]
MPDGQSDERQFHCYIKCAAMAVLIFLVSSACGAQTTPADEPPSAQSLQALTKNPELMKELGKLMEKLQHGIQYPPPRDKSRLLPLLPESTIFYSASPNYGEALRQALVIFRKELEESPALRDWWLHGPLAASGPKVEDALDKASQLSQFLGDEIVVSGAPKNREPDLLIVAEVRKPGLKNFLQQTLKDLSPKSNPPVRIYDQQELDNAMDSGSSQELKVLVRPDYVVAAPDLASLRSFNTQMERGGLEFASTSFGQRVARAYDGGVTGLGAVDLQNLLKQIPIEKKQSQMLFQRTGFADMKYLVWEHKGGAGQAVSQAELSFTGPRHGIASWLAAPAPLGSLDFLSPKAMLAGAAQLKNPAQILDDVMELAEVTSPNASAGLAQIEQMLNLNLNEDLLNLLRGEIAFELDDISPPLPAWKVLLRVKDPIHLQQTLTTLLAAAHLVAEPSDEGGISYYTVRIPSAKAKSEVIYAFADDYLIAASTREGVAQAIRLHQSGESLGKSKRFLASIPPGHPSGVSGMLYEDPITLVSRSLRQVAPEIVGPIENLAGQTPMVLICGYGEETAIRKESSNVAFDAGVVLVAAAIAIPNLLRSRIAANEASAVGSVRTLVTAQVTYASLYPERGFARDLATLGPDPAGTTASSADHAAIIDATLGNPICTAGEWCVKSGYRFIITPDCKQRVCADFVAVGTPVSTDTGVRSFCSTSDGIIRFNADPPLTSPISASECRAWRPLQ